MYYERKTSTYLKMEGLILSSAIFGEENVILLQPCLAEIFDINEALVLNQIHYWLQRSKHIIGGRVWVYNTYDQWQRQIRYISVTSIRQAIKRLEKRGILISGNFNKLKMDKTKWYTIDYKLVKKLYLELKKDLAEKEAALDEENKADESDKCKEEIETRTVQNRQSSVRNGQSTVPFRQSSCQNRTARHNDFDRPIPETTAYITTDNYDNDNNNRGQPICQGYNNNKFSKWSKREESYNVDRWKQSFSTVGDKNKWAGYKPPQPKYELDFDMEDIIYK